MFIGTVSSPRPSPSPRFAFEVCQSILDAACIIPNVHSYLSFTSCDTNGNFMGKWSMYSVTSLSACENYVWNFDAEVGRDYFQADNQEQEVLLY